MKIRNNYMLLCNTLYLTLKYYFFQKTPFFKVSQKLRSKRSVLKRSDPKWRPKTKSKNLLSGPPCMLRIRITDYLQFATSQNTNLIRMSILFRSFFKEVANRYTAILRSNLRRAHVFLPISKKKEVNVAVCLLRTHSGNYDLIWIIVLVDRSYFKRGPL